MFVKAGNKYRHHSYLVTFPSDHHWPWLCGGTCFHLTVTDQTNSLLVIDVSQYWRVKGGSSCGVYTAWPVTVSLPQWMWTITEAAAVYSYHQKHGWCRVMRGILGRLCGSAHASPNTVPHSPLRGADRKQVGDVCDLNTSHVRFQDSDLGNIYHQSSINNNQ